MTENAEAPHDPAPKRAGTILGRLTRAVQEQNWFAVTLELMIVVIGVFLGIQLGNWNATRIEAREAAAYRIRLVEDVHTDLDAMALRIAYFDGMRAHGLTALTALKGPLDSLGGAFLVDAYQATQEWLYSPARTAYNEMVSAGRVNLIPDTDLRTRLAIYYNQTDEYLASWTRETDYRERVRTVLPIALQERIHAACEEVVLTEGGSSVVADRVEPCDVEFSPEEVRQGVAALTSEPDFPRLLTRQLSVLDEKLRMFRDRRDQAHAVLTYLNPHP